MKTDVATHAAMRASMSLATLFAALHVGLAVDHSKFRTCAKTGFCRRRRNPEKHHGYVVAPTSLSLSTAGTVTGTLHGGEFGVSLTLTLQAYASGASRLRITETNPLHGPRWEPNDILEPELLTTPLRSVGVAELEGHPLEAAAAAKEVAVYAYAHEVPNTASPSAAAAEDVLIAIQLHPFKATLYRGSTAALTLNPGGRLYFEHHRKRDDAAVPITSVDSDVHGGKTIVDFHEDGLAVYSDGTKQKRAEDAPAADAGAMAAAARADDLWEEQFGSHRDSKPFGPASVGMDVTYESAAHVYGLAEHAAPLNLPSTTGPGARYADPYRMYTLDVYDYELDSPMALYGGVPLLLAHSPNTTVGTLWLNPTETFIDISRRDAERGLISSLMAHSEPRPSTSAYWMSESGVIDVFMLPGPSPQRIFSQYAALTGSTPLPPRFALGYHQCRWNYNDEEDVRYVHGKFEELDLPFDVLWLDIEHTDGKRYFTWDKYKFAHPKEMQQQLAATGRKMVTIVDPHIKKDMGYSVYTEAHEKGYFINKADGQELDGWCWPGSSAYVDFTSEKVRDWWASRFAYDKYEGSTPTLYTWNDMNEPSVFNGPEVSMNKDAKSIAGIEHREWHNLYGMYMHQATALGLLRRNPGEDSRPFVLSRSFYAGSQRWGAIWTGDNACKWSHLEAATPMLLSLGLCGITFSGADVGGFLGKGSQTDGAGRAGWDDPDAELFTRWFAAGAYQPFFRGHAHEKSGRREPWTFDDETTVRLRAFAMQRYQLLAYWYTLFFLAETTGMPTMRPLWVSFPTDEQTFDNGKQWMAGGDLMVAPVTTQGATSVNVYFPGPVSQLWYDVVSGRRHAAPSEARIDAPIDAIPVFQRGGSIVPRQMRLRRSSVAMADDPFTLVVAPTSGGSASGRLYLDSGDGYSYRKGAYAYWKFDLSEGQLTAKPLHKSDTYSPSNVLERLELLNTAPPESITLSTADGATRELTFTHVAATNRLVVRKPDVPVASGWSITIKHATI